MRRMSYFLAGLLVVAVAVLVLRGRSISAEVPAVGTPAPDFTLASQDGKPVSLSSYRGQWVVLYFYPKDFTSGCTTEAHNFQRDQAWYMAKHAVVLGVSVDNADSHRRFCAKEGLNFKLLADTDRRVSAQYGSLMNLGVVRLSSRHTFIIDPEGKIARTFTSVNPGKHSEEVLAALAELQRN